MQNSGEPKGSPRIMIRYIMNKNALKDFTPFCDENCKNRTQAMVNEDEVVCTFYIPSNMQRLKCSYGYLWIAVSCIFISKDWEKSDRNSWGFYILDDFGIISDLLDLIIYCCY